MRSIAFLLAHSRRVLILAILTGFFSGACNTGLLALVNRLLLHGGAVERGRLLWLFGTLCLVVPLSRMLSEVLVIRIGQQALSELRMRMSAQILEVPLRQLEEIGAPSLLSILTGDIPTVTFAVTALPMMCVNFAVIVTCLVYLGVLSPRLLAIMAAPLLIGIATYQTAAAISVRYLLRARDSRERLYHRFRDLVEGSKMLKLHFPRRQAFLNQTLHQTVDRHRREQAAGQVVFAVATSWIQLLLFVIIGVLLLFVPRWSGGHDASTAIAFIVVLLYLTTPLYALMNGLPLVAQAEVAFKRIETMGLTLRRQATESACAPAPARTAWQRLEMVGVTHAYSREGEERDFVLGPIDLALTPGRLIFLVGGNGSGKTTLAKLLVGLYIPRDGEIRLDGVPVTDQNRESYRQQFSVVFSDFFLFEELLGLGSDQLDESARRYLRELHLAHKVTIANGRLSTTDLSQGQRKRLALLTAYLEDRPIYVFDEWAADQDPLFKSLFYTQLLRDLKKRGKTIIVISHDDAYYGLADEIIKVDSGRLMRACPTIGESGASSGRPS